MEKPNLESLIKDLYNHARHDLSEDLVAIKREETKYRGTAASALMYGELFKML